MRRGAGRLWAAGLLLLPVAGSALQGSVGLEYDDNPFAAPSARRAGWVNRLYLSSTRRLLERPWGEVRLRCQGGVKRFWRAEEAADAPGRVLAGHAELEGAAQLRRALSLTWVGELKARGASRLSREPSYVHGGLQASLRADLGHRLAAGLGVRAGQDAAHSRDLADVGVRAVTAQAVWTPAPRLQGHLALSQGRVEYERPPLARTPEGGLLAGTGRQTDRRRELLAGLQLYHGMLLDASYGRVRSRSNSYGYGYLAHRGQLVLSRGLWGAVDGQVFLAAERRRYAGDLGAAERRDEYALRLLSLRLSRPLGSRYAVSAEYRHGRSGDQGPEGSYRRNAYALALDLSL